MANRTPSRGGKDLQDLRSVSRFPGVALLQRRAVPSAPRPKQAASLSAAPLLQEIPATGAMAEAGRAMFQALQRFAPGDYRAWFTEYLRFRFGRRHAFATYEGRHPPDGVYPLEGEDGEVRLAIAGDWGTGTDEAHRVAELMTDGKPHYTIHLGDVYFVGDRSEVRENFLGLARDGSAYAPCRWPSGSRAAFALNGNHEMYARGIAYFEDILPAMGPVVEGRAQGQPASYFAMMNEHWCVLGLDTGYNSVGWPVIEYIRSPDAALPEPVVRWLAALAPPIGGRAVVLLTHHQVLSVFDDVFTRQADQIFAILKRPVLWFWGHEHRLALYEPFDGRARGWPTITGRCVGHGGMPVDLPGARRSRSLGAVAFLDERLYHNDERLRVGVNGFARLAFKGEALAVDYVDVHGDSVFTERFRARDGAVHSEGHVNRALREFTRAPAVG